MHDRDQSLKAARIAAWFMELPSGNITFDPIKAEQLGYDPKDFSHYTDFTDLIHPDDYEPTMEAMRQHMKGLANMYKTTYRIKAADGKWHRYMDQGVIQTVMADGSMTIFGATVDVT